MSDKDERPRGAGPADDDPVAPDRLDALNPALDNGDSGDLLDSDELATLDAQDLDDLLTLDAADAGAPSTDEADHGRASD